ncbi:Adenylyltransferase and sulfurtransferase UBA4 [Rhizoctonia solani]|uniref:Adenylyltransferase and sulfurtransferase UBA4 n=1 Tax=Rhizoctonia solani TaxID=456999 RepID=A0A8H7IBF4_9AGAM|nr:Adenylyltransferase and sulfurtransferase UBA4 [Rhizoctonia solani]
MQRTTQIRLTGAGAERCSDVGVLGPVVGVIGVLMALETIKILTGFGIEECQLHTPSMLLFTGLSPRPFRNIKLRPRQSKCPGCSTDSPQGLPVPELMADLASLQDSYYQYCDIDSHLPDDPILTGARRGEPGMRVKASVLRDALVSAAASSTASPTIIDTRPPTEFGICSIPGSVICRLGNDSQVAVRALRGALQAKEDGSQANLDNASSASPQRIVDVIGGLRAWAQEVDQSFPIY